MQTEFVKEMFLMGRKSEPSGSLSVFYNRQSVCALDTDFFHRKPYGLCRAELLAKELIALPLGAREAEAVGGFEIERHQPA